MIHSQNQQSVIPSTPWISVSHSHSTKGFQRCSTSQMSQWGAAMPSGTALDTWAWVLSSWCSSTDHPHGDKLQRTSLKAERDKQYAAADGAKKMLYELFLCRKIDHKAAKAFALAGVIAKQHQSVMQAHRANIMTLAKVMRSKEGLDFRIVC